MCSFCQVHGGAAIPPSLPPSLTNTEDLARSLEYSLYSAMHSHEGLDFMAPLL